ncbi:phage holin family protein [Phenylobacterium sp. 20VBR1]|uniref:Phage holin family protein n=1 Tax=Phenylobacterium glaciei TaxID=2803784 RepID=A0A941HV56_9CAUL|nr:phage holin family protein [Phenylobacterium glaciei]MBR7618270.1 phage holin family protein [Phenylobacterium glaciei]
MSRFLLRILIAALGLWLAAVLLPGVSYAGWLDLLLAALLLGLVNAIVRPVVFLLTLPLTILTLGLFLLVVNAAMIGLVALLLPGFMVSGLISGILASIIVGVVSWIGAVVLGDGKAD